MSLIRGAKMRIGKGFDVHKLIDGTGQDKKLIVGAVHIDHEKVLLGHSDADVLVHAIMDALLGAAGLDDIGSYFPDNDPQYKGIESIKLLAKVLELIKEQGFKIENIDSTIIAERPKFRPYIKEMRENISKCLGIDFAQVSVKATTTEGLGFTGREEGIAAEAIVLLS